VALSKMSVSIRMLIFNSNTSEEIRMITGTCVHLAGIHRYITISNHLYCSFKGFTRLYQEEQPDLLISLWLAVRGGGGIRQVLFNTLPLQADGRHRAPVRAAVRG
jgi:hypothetical protein